MLNNKGTYAKGCRGTCPYCCNTVRFEKIEENDSIEYEIWHKKELIRVGVIKCPLCSKAIVTIESFDYNNGNWDGRECPQMIYPLGSARSPIPPKVPEQIAQDYKEACLVEPLSKKASAALARRCLQNILRDPNAGNVKPDNLSKEIDQVKPTLPTYLVKSIDAIRKVGNFGAHPIKCQHTGEIVEVEQGETEWLLDTLEELFDHYYVKPQRIKRIKQKEEALNKKLKEAGKPPLK